jgi:hypothetical protein
MNPLGNVIIRPLKEEDWEAIVKVDEGLATALAHELIKNLKVIGVKNDLHPRQLGRLVSPPIHSCHGVDRGGIN